MAVDTKIQRVNEIADRAAKAHNVILYDVEYLKAAKTLRVYIDRANTGVSLDDCALVSEAISNDLDTSDIFPSDYHLEVSSPGVERQLREKWHYEQVIEKTVEIKLFQPLGAYFSDVEKKLEKTKVFQCVLKEVKIEEVLVELQGREFLIPLKNITKANLVFEM